MKRKNSKVKVRIHKYNFYLGRNQTFNRTITKKKYNEIKEWTKGHPEFKNAFSIKKIIT